MELKEIRKIVNQSIETFVDALGLDGEYYSSLNCSPMTYAKLEKIDGKAVPGKYLSPHSRAIEYIIKKQKPNWTNDKKDIARDRGLILVNEIYKDKKIDNDLIITFVHETLHSLRNVLVYDVFRDENNEDAYFHKNGVFEQNVEKYYIEDSNKEEPENKFEDLLEFSFKDRDPSQEILHGKIDNSQKTINKFQKKDSFEIDEERDEVIAEKMEKQKAIDEALIETMAILSVFLNSKKKKGESIDIWDALETLKENESGDIKAVCELVLKHHDLQLFDWQLDPIGQTYGDIHYDFFENYITQDDEEIVNRIYEQSDYIVPKEDKYDER